MFPDTDVEETGYVRYIDHYYEIMQLKDENLRLRKEIVQIYQAVESAQQYIRHATQCMAESVAASRKGGRHNE